MKTVKIRPRSVLQAFQWDGSDVEGFSRVGPFLCCVNHYDGGESFASVGDWVVAGIFGGHFAWDALDFDATYEVVDE